METKLYKVLSKIHQSYFDHSHRFCMHYARACMQNILTFLEQIVQFFCQLLKLFPNNHQITEKINKPRLLIVLI